MDYVNVLSGLFEQLKIKAIISKCRKEDAFLIFDIKLLSGGTYKKIEKHSTEIALALKSLSLPLIYPITKDGIIRMEVMISEQETVYFEKIKNNLKNTSARIPLVLGKKRDGEIIIIDLTKMPHLLIAGTTGSGKSVLLQSIINGLIEQNNVKLALMDPKRVEFSNYDGMNNLYAPVAKDISQSKNILINLISEMEERFKKLESAGVKDIYSYKGKMPFIVTIIDELADLMLISKKEIPDLICRLAQKSRACGIHLIIATQRPTVNIITGSIKANFPARISCQVSSSIDSRTVLEKNGAETLIGKGDSIIDCNEYKFTRFKAAFLKESEIIKNIKDKKSFWSNLWNF